MAQTTKTTVTSFKAECHDCDWKSLDPITGRCEACSHSRKFGHEVTFEVSYFGIHSGDGLTSKFKHFTEPDRHDSNGDCHGSHI